MYCIYIDEAGRGPIAGPVYVGIVVEKIVKRPGLDWFAEVNVFSKKKKKGEQSQKQNQLPKLLFPCVDPDVYTDCIDSKLLTATQREIIYKNLTTSKKLQYSTGMASAKEIDAFGIVWGLRKAIFRAIHKRIFPEKKIFSQRAVEQRVRDNRNDIVLVVDGPNDFGLSKKLGIPVIPVIDGDDLIPMISGASILAKVERDAYMDKIRDKKYGFAKHKGYGTKDHYTAVQIYGFHKEHRKSFIHI